MPSYSELMVVVGFQSKNAAYKLVKRCMERGWLEKDAHGKLLPGRRFFTLRLLGTVAAGFPSPAEEELVDTISLDEWLIRNKEATFLLHITGDSMIEAGVLPGDYVMVERGLTCELTEIMRL
jgi:SOS-response transcriptional repressor LexA